MTEEQKQALTDRYLAAAHAMQSGVAYKMPIDPSDTTPKHLRVGVNSAMRDHASLVELLMKKGIITEEEYMTALAEGMEEEAEMYKKILSGLYGANVNLK